MTMIFLSLSFIVTCLALIQFFQILRRLTVRQFRLQKYIELCMATANPTVRRVMEKIAKTPDKELPSLDVKELFSKEALSMLYEVKNYVKSLISVSEKPEDKVRAEKVTVEIEAMVNLMATVDDQSSPEYVRQVCEEIIVSIEKIKNEEQ
jgi:hypothetical protein